MIEVKIEAIMGFQRVLTKAELDVLSKGLTYDEIKARQDLTIMAEAECLSCHHSYWDHEGRFDEAERARISKHRVIGCRVCGCAAFRDSDIRMRDESTIVDYDTNCFNPDHEYGNQLPYVNHPKYVIDDFFKTYLMKHAAKILPKSTFYQIRGIVADPLYHKFSVAWYYCRGGFPAQEQIEAIYDPPIYKDHYYLMAGCRV